MARVFMAGSDISDPNTTPGTQFRNRRDEARFVESRQGAGARKELTIAT
ncbi:MAG TPA: hypothetical protein VG651_13130 [Stellaceae bacterium]|nr:hypothetical protein [Stellaceae bacterium]